jgi:hypothetical protein
MFHSPRSDSSPPSSHADRPSDVHDGVRSEPCQGIDPPDLCEWIPLSETSRFLPRRNGKKVHRTTLGRWASRGRGGVVLRTWVLGGVRYTTRRAILEFVRRLSTSGRAVDRSDSHRSASTSAGSSDSKADASTSSPSRRDGVEAALKRFGL